MTDQTTRARLDAAIGEAEGWQPIDTAPKDGTLIDVWCLRRHCHGATEHVRKCDVSWGEMVNNFTGAIYEGWRGLGEVYAENTPTHWMPRPAPPEDRSA